MQKYFNSRLKWTARVQKTGFSNLSTNEKFDGHTFK